MKNKPTRHFSKIQEKQVAKLIGGKTTPNSGATPYIKGDVVKNDIDNSWLIECKTCTTNKQSFAIKKEWLTSTKKQAFESGKLYYALAFNYGPNQENYYIIDEKKFKEIINEGNS